MSVDERREREDRGNEEGDERREDRRYESEKRVKEVTGERKEEQGEGKFLI